MRESSGEGCGGLEHSEEFGGVAVEGERGIEREMAREKKRGTMAACRSLVMVVMFQSPTREKNETELFPVWDICLLASPFTAPSIRSSPARKP